jgi:hypothetical protein
LGRIWALIIPLRAIADVDAVAAHYDDLDELYRSIWGTNIHHGYWTNRQNPLKTLSTI